MDRPKLIKVQAPLPGFGIVSFGTKPSVKSRQTERDDKHSPHLVRFDTGMHAKREYEKPSQLKTERETGNIWEIINN